MAKQVVYSEGKLLTEDGDHVGTSAVADSGNYAPATVNPVAFGAVGDGVAHYLDDEFTTEAQFLAEFPLSWAVWTYWLKRVVRGKPGGVNDPNQSDVSDWRNLTLDWVGLQEAFETGGYIFCPSLSYVTSDTLLVRQYNTTVIHAGSIYQTRGGSRGNMLAIGEGHDITWEGGSFDAVDALGDNPITLFQNQITTSQSGWATINARRTILRGFRCFNAVKDATYGGGKGFSVQFGCHAASISDFHIVDCDLGMTVEGKTSSVPLAGPTPAEAYNAVGITISNGVVENASIAGYHQVNSSNVDNPLAGSVSVYGVEFINCASNNTDVGVISGDRAANLKMSAKVISTLTDQITPVRGTWQDGVDLDLTVNAYDVYSLVDTRNSVGMGASASLGADGATFRMKAKIRANTATYLIRKATGTGGDCPTPQRCNFDLDVKGFEIAGTQVTAISQANMSLSNLVKVVSFNPAVSPSTLLAVGGVEQTGSELPIPYSGLQAPLDTVERGGTQGITKSTADVNVLSKQFGRQVHVTTIGIATALGSTSGSKWLLQSIALPRGTLSTTGASAVVTGSSSPTVTRFDKELVVGDSVYSVVAGVYTLLGTILSIASATSLTLTANALAVVADTEYAFHDGTHAPPSLLLVQPA